MIYGTQPPTWLIFAAFSALALLALALSSVFGLAAAWLFDWFYRRREGEAE